MPNYGATVANFTLLGPGTIRLAIFRPVESTISEAKLCVEGLGWLGLIFGT